MCHKISLVHNPCHCSYTSVSEQAYSKYVIYLLGFHLGSTELRGASIQES